ncbi:MAG TPA: host attachment protein [Candidatus Methylacidiphilales bacterium]|nr:host attachment protein [Candidatus Methylacidiphilales bacterium]
MKPPEFFVVADRGHMKAFSIKEATGRDFCVKLLDKIDIEEAYMKYDERFTDQAGAFPSYSAPGIANSVAEKLSLETEKKNRISRRLVEQLSAWLTEHKPKYWGLAAAGEVNNALLHDLGAAPQKNMVCNIKRDLIHVPATEILDHIRRECAS